MSYYELKCEVCGQWKMLYCDGENYAAECDDCRRRAAAVHPREERSLTDEVVAEIRRIALVRP